LEQNLDWQKWFTTPLQIWNEKSLITHEGDELIPDRVMEFDSEIIVVDYKTGEKNKKYAVQINSYVNFLTNLFEKPVKGCLVYLKSAEIEKITAS